MQGGVKCAIKNNVYFVVKRPIMNYAEIVTNSQKKKLLLKMIKVFGLKMLEKAMNINFTIKTKNTF